MAAATAGLVKEPEVEMRAAVAVVAVAAVEGAVVSTVAGAVVPVRVVVAVERGNLRAAASARIASRKRSVLQCAPSKAKSKLRSRGGGGRGGGFRGKRRRVSASVNQ